MEKGIWSSGKAKKDSPVPCPQATTNNAECKLGLYYYAYVLLKLQMETAISHLFPPYSMKNKTAQKSKS